MDQDEPATPSKPVKASLSAREVREAKLARALRDNLRRRKGTPSASPDASGPGVEKD
jgi:hypothetical protein